MQKIADSIANIHTLKDGKKITDINYSRVVTRKYNKEEKKKEETKIEFEPDIDLD